MKRETVNLTVLLILVVFISFVFLKMIQGFLLALLMAALLAGLMRPVFGRLLGVCRGHRGAASVLTIVLLFFLILVPLGGMATMVTAQAIKVGNSVGPWVSENLTRPDALSQRLQELPFYDSIAPYRDDILKRAAELAATVSSFLVDSLSAVTRGTVRFVFLFFVMLYALYFFLVAGGRLLDLILYYLPLKPDDEARMLAKFTSVSRATIKGTAVIGLIQGTLGGLGFAVAGIDAAAFWGTIMVVLSVVPGVGTGLVWVPAVVILAMGGHWLPVVLLTVYFVVVVGMVDNVLRPRLVGRDTQMPDLLVFLSTLGGLSLFGALGFIIGPIVAALFVTVWEIYGRAFASVLPALAAPEDAAPGE